MGKLKKYVTLVLTHQCNLRCTYCYEKHKDFHTMSFKTAKSILDKEFELDDKTTSMEISLFGGEPFLEFNLIKKLVEYYKNKKTKKDFIFFITTNGALVNEEMKKWLKANKRYLQVALSLDGNKEMHDMNRSNSFDQIDLAFFRDTYKKQPIKMTISKETLPTLAEGVIFCHKFGFEILCNLAFQIDWSDTKNKEILIRELSKLIDFYTKNPKIKPCSMLDYRRIISIPYNLDKNYRTCGAGWLTKAYDYDGERYPCQFFLPLSVGEEKAKASKLIKFHTKEIPDDYMNKDCVKCVLKNICQICYGSNYASTGNIFNHDENMCRLYKIQFKAIAYFAVEKFKLGQFKNMKKEMSASILKGALMINDAFSD